MALTLSGRLYDPYGNALPNAGIRFKAVSTSTQILRSVDQEVETDSSGNYSIEVRYGVYDISVRQSQSDPWYKIASDIPVTTDSTSNDLNALIVAYQGDIDATPEIVLEIEAIAATATAAASSAAASAQAASDAVASVTTDASNLPVTASGSDTERTLGDRFGEVVNVKDFGAKGDWVRGAGGTDDSGAFQSAISYAVSQEATLIAIPPGNYLLSSSVSETFGGYKRIVIMGDSSRSSRLIIDNEDGGILLTSTARSSPVSLLNLQICSTRPNAGTAFSYVGVTGGDQQQRVFDAQNVQIGPEEYGNSTDQAFNKYLVAEGVFRPYLMNVMIHQSAAATHKGEVGVSFDGSYKAHVANSYINVNVDVGYSDQGGGGEGFFMTETTINGADTAVIHTRSDDREPEFFIDNCHMNSRVANIVIEGCKYGWITSNLLYCQDGISSFRDIIIRDSEQIVIKDNIYRQPYDASRVHIFLDGNATGGVKNITIQDAGLEATAQSYILATSTVQNLSIVMPEYESTDGFVSYSNLLDIRTSSVKVSSQSSLTSFDGGAAEGPIYTLMRRSGSPAANDSLGGLSFAGNDSDGSEVPYAKIVAGVRDAASGTHAGRLRVFTWGSGAGYRQIEIADGVAVGGTAVPKGSGTVNAQAGYFVNGVEGVSGSFASSDGKTITVVGGIVTSIA